ncbi:hypothetical protein BD289DRAFT_363538 [Coniella lustricola]|uniref:J domain-containing protein n=1 Tax=Coniella lustricola TaxID=2025994 RepID=A0A2T3AFA1_9PEZI|nr:hypothetical protein BD289DRAFT_363538 [Coniella lustricola]
MDDDDDDYVRARQDLDKARRLRFKRRKARRAKASTTLHETGGAVDVEAGHQPDADDHQTEAAAAATSGNARKRATSKDGSCKSRRPHKRRRQTEEHEPRHPPATDPFAIPPSATPTVAFSESLYDALADSEGAAYWEKVYGQPIHTYPRNRLNPETGELEQRDWDDYCAYVQAEMFKRTHAGYIEEQQRRAKTVREAAAQGQERMKRDEEEKQREEDNARLKRDIERSLNRAEQRRKARHQLRVFESYVQRWDQWDGAQSSIAWPTATGDNSNMTERGIRSFFVHGLDLKNLGRTEFAAQLKAHRVRWHPDKMQQRLGGKDKVDKRIMADITLIFQVIDTLWEDTRKAK